MTKRQIIKLCLERGFLFEFEVDNELYFYKRYNTHEGKLVIRKDVFHNAYVLEEYYIVGKNYYNNKKIDYLKNAFNELQIDALYFSEIIE